jgi:hypothetical protein
MSRSVGVGYLCESEGSILLSARVSGLMSPKRTIECCCKSSTKVKKRERLMRPTGRSRALMRAGAIGDSGSTGMITSNFDLT